MHWTDLLSHVPLDYGRAVRVAELGRRLGQTDALGTNRPRSSVHPCQKVAHLASHPPVRPLFAARMVWSDTNFDSRFGLRRFLLSTHYTRYDRHPALFSLNFFSLVVFALLPKLPLVSPPHQRRVIPLTVAHTAPPTSVPFPRPAKRLFQRPERACHSHRAAAFSLALAFDNVRGSWSDFSPRIESVVAADHRGAIVGVKEAIESAPRRAALRTRLYTPPLPFCCLVSPSGF
jgi:hypothetical protein